MGRVCAQPGTDPNDSGGGKCGPKPTQRGSRIFRFGSRWVGIGFITRDKIWSDLAEKYLVRSGRKMARSVEIWPRFRRITARSCRSGREIVIIRRKDKGFDSGQVSRVWKPKTDNRPAWGRISFAGTRVRPPESSDRVAVGRTWAGWPG